MDDADPISQFFPDHEDNILYTVLGITPDATTADINVRLHTPHALSPLSHSSSPSLPAPINNLLFSP